MQSERRGEIKMYGLKELLQQEKARMEDIISRAREGLSNMPEGHLRISKDNERIRFYHCTNDRNGVYIPKSDDKLPKQLAQKSYNHAVIKLAENRICQLNKLLQDYSDDEIEQIYKKLHDERQALITPIDPTIEQKIKKWFEEPYNGREFQEGTAVIYSERGERVRSKSEKILADYFYKNDIPYLYEKPLFLKGYGTVYPDFTFFSGKLGKEIYWEHEGQMDKPDYARSAVKKLNLYQKNGIYIGERLILTFETETEVLNPKIISSLVSKYLV